MYQSQVPILLGIQKKNYGSNTYSPDHRELPTAFNYGCQNFLPPAVAAVRYHTVVKGSPINSHSHGEVENAKPVTYGTKTGASKSRFRNIY